jgi:hypothetical protein
LRTCVLGYRRVGRSSTSFALSPFFFEIHCLHLLLTVAVERLAVSAEARALRLGLCPHPRRGRYKRNCSAGRCFTLLRSGGRRQVAVAAAIVLEPPVSAITLTVTILSR